jgi:copper chaperone CopZ
MQTKRFEVPTLYGDHHVLEVRRILSELAGVSEVYASSAFQVVEVTFDESSIDEAKLAAALDEAGYLGEWSAPAEQSTSERAGEAREAQFRHTAVYETIKTTVSFAHRVSYEGRPLWPCPGIGTIRGKAKEAEHA